QARGQGVGSHPGPVPQRWRGDSEWHHCGEFRCTEGKASGVEDAEGRVVDGSLYRQAACGDVYVTTAEAYAVCGAIAHREAKNFYYSFRVLPKHKRNAMCAVYAFMRHADDISDDEALPVAQRREVMGRWLEAWRDSRRSGVSDDPVFLALNDTQRRF